MAASGGRDTNLEIIAIEQEEEMTDGRVPLAMDGILRGFRDTTSYVEDTWA